MTSLLRPDGPAKLTGTATYAADAQVPDVLYAALVTATVPNGRVVAVDKPDTPGVVAVIDHTNVGTLTQLPSPPLGHSMIPLQTTEVHYDGQPVAVVLAETLEQAQHAATLVSVTYSDTSPPPIFGQTAQIAPGSGLFKAPTDKKGDVDAGLASADKTVHGTYTTADRHHSPIEPSATIAWWEGDQLTVHTSTQSSQLAQTALAGLFQIPREHVRVVCAYVGGGFGSKGYVWPHLILAAAAAKVSGRAVKLVMTRAQMFSLAGHQPITSQTVTLGATADGKLTAIRHLSVNAAARVDAFVESTTGATTWLYDSPNIETDLKVEALDKPQPTPMRAPAEGPGLFPLESAMDELAVELGIDPVELRMRNDASVDPLTGKPFSSRKLVECLTEGAARFGWADREPHMRDGDWQIGWGMAVATFGAYRAPSAARVRVDSDGHVVVESDMQEIGSGLPAMVQIIAAETLGCDPSDVEVRHGDSSYPPHTGTFGSLSSGSLSAAVQNAASSVMEKLQAQPGDSLADLVDAAGLEFVESEGSWAPDQGGEDYSIKSFGAVFAEVRVDADLGLVRVPRIVGVYSAGRIINQVAAHSQMTGGIIWGYGQALLERSVMEPRLGRFLSRNLAGYVVPVNADIGDIDVSFVEEDDRIASPSGARGIGELGACGVGPAIANAVFHATGRRVRSLPIRIHDLL
ncbi:xanthine dehydrogenase family protein molybdopterin-binding subunit [Kibdelosporangium aridum]|uniref:Xanthine dehydrogenase family protein molybdopterin-binding subunit n=1 Tax=Kibdelosporangium aridum TaxID=2030 RepID=A0A428YY23_KIBAR|nr:xanthine dehydrogenase family protein molybdopterin-binding subunit [Kibdelosporangium aridum]RSM75095.1 xanthine dehydrogenase family protein molybdopterin-binding subunit [Kibdelosporangium aridum]